VGEFMSFFTAMALAFQPMRRLGGIAGLWTSAAASLERLYRVFDTEPTIFSPPAPRPVPGEVTIRVENVVLAFGELPVLRGVSFTAEAGKTTALVGASGAGKSTLFNVLTRLVDPQEGRVSLGAEDIRDMDLGELRALFSVVTQDTLLFDETVRENIVLGRTDVPEERMAEVLKAAHVEDFLDKLPEGLESHAGPRGSKLSGGQRQRVAIARALLRDTPILLLDEATSALDAASEAVVQQALERLSEGRTTLVIAHRLSTIRGADKIIVMDQGRVVDQGSHEELFARGGIYAELCRLQFVED
jgi:ABC-type multidrug transport system fused ATPase/permease subunit